MQAGLHAGLLYMGATHHAGAGNGISQLGQPQGGSGGLFCVCVVQAACVCGSNVSLGRDVLESNDDKKLSVTVPTALH